MRREVAIPTASIIAINSGVVASNSGIVSLKSGVVSLASGNVQNWSGIVSINSGVILNHSGIVLNQSGIALNQSGIVQTYSGVVGVNNVVTIMDDRIHPTSIPVWVPDDIGTSFSLSTDAAANTFGAYTEIINATSATKKTDITGVLVVGLVAGTYELQVGIGPGGSEAEIGVTRFTWPAAATQSVSLPILAARIPSSTRVAARIKGAGAGIKTGTFMFESMEYPVGV